ncbi:MAG TPA: hypothetical protein VF316_18625 [Polyangiaceae bacterium]
MRTRGIRIFAAVLVASGVACKLLPTRDLSTAFNGGVLDSTYDNAYPRSQRAADTVMWRMRDELGEGYFDQGPGSTRTVGWLTEIERHAGVFMEDALRTGDVTADLDASYVTPPPAVTQNQVQVALDRYVSLPTPPPTDVPLCSDRAPNPSAIEALADRIRFTIALERAVDHARELLYERFATMGEVIEGATRAFHDSSAYLANRRWKRDFRHPTTGLVVKGGAATGIYSAGVVWVALNLVHQCISSGVCDAGSSGFMLASGTSTGATIVGAVDIFHTSLKSEDSRKGALKRYLDWYLCSSLNDLYCVRNQSAINLARGPGASPDKIQDSMLDFNGLASKIESNYHCDEMNNPMELVLNTVDFRTGRLYSLSDQDPGTLRSPWDVDEAIVSSAALPFIVRPTYKLPTDPLADAGSFAYLDGGIRSELPVLALVRRGVERVLVVSSGASVTSDTGQIPNALDMAIRYIDVSTGGVTESELEHAQMRVEASRLAEHESCVKFLRRHDQDAVRSGGTTLCTGTCDPDAVCSGDFKHACERDPKTVKPDDGTSFRRQLVAHSWQMTKVWRDEQRVPGLHGYAFDPVEQRRLMLAGAEAAREKCVEIAVTLGIDVEKVPRDTLYAWCSPRLPTTQEQCPADVLARALQAKAAPDCPAGASESTGPVPADPRDAVACNTAVRP